MKMNKTLMLTFLLIASAQVQAQPDEGFREAMDACLSETGVTKPERGTRPTKEDRAKLKACLAEKGVTLPHRRGGRRERDE